MILNAKTPSEAYASLLRTLLTTTQRRTPRGLPCLELRDAIVSISEPSDEPIVTRDEKRNVAMRRYLAAEFDLYARGVDSTQAFAEHASFWREVADGELINSAYGKIVWFDKSLASGETPWEWAKRALLTDPDTRQAVVLFMRPDHVRETKDLVCTMHGVFSIVDAELNFTVVMRSNDAVRGWVYDAPWFQHLQLRMLRELRDAGLSVELGTYLHFAHSLHLYERDVPLAKRMLGQGDDR